MIFLCWFQTLWRSNGRTWLKISAASSFMANESLLSLFSYFLALLVKNSDTFAEFIEAYLDDLLWKMASPRFTSFFATIRRKMPFHGDFHSCCCSVEAAFSTDESIFFVAFCGAVEKKRDRHHWLEAASGVEYAEEPKSRSSLLPSTTWMTKVLLSQMGVHEDVSIMS